MERCDCGWGIVNGYRGRFCFGWGDCGDFGFGSWGGGRDLLGVDRIGGGEGVFYYYIKDRSGDGWELVWLMVGMWEIRRVYGVPDGTCRGIFWWIWWK